MKKDSINFLAFLPLLSLLQGSTEIYDMIREKKNNVLTR